MKLRYLFLFTFALLLHRALAQKGNYFLHNYLPAQYNASDQNRCILQDLYGRIIVANNDGLLINNGAEWEKLTLPFLCLSLSKNEDEEVFVAGDGDFGKLTQNKNGSFKFESLKQFIPKGEKELGKFWTIICIKDHVYFCSNQKILDYVNGNIKIILPGDEGFHTFFKVENHLIVREKGKGLKILTYGNEFVLIKGGEQFASNDNPVRGIIKGKICHYIVTPQSIYEFPFNGTLPELSSIKKTDTPINQWLSEKNAYCASNIGENNFAFGSTNGGVVITDLQFNPVKYINSANELQEDAVNYIYNDNQGHIWLALAKGISLIEFNSPITKFTKADGIKGTIEACIFFKGTSFLATNKGVLKYNSSLLKFESTNITETAWGLAECDGKLLVGAKSGLYILENNDFKLIYETPSTTHCVFIHPEVNDLIYLGTETGYAKGRLLKNTFVPLKENFEMESDIRTIGMNSDKSICFGLTQNNIYVETKGSDSLIQLSLKDGLPGLMENYVFSNKINLLIGTEIGIYKIDYSNKNFKIIPDPAFKLLNKYLISKAISIKDNVWLTSKPDAKVSESLMCLEKINGNYEIKKTQLSRIKESDVKSFCFSDSLVYVGTNNGLYCYDLVLKPSRFGLNTFVNSFICGSDSIYNIHPKTVLTPLRLLFQNNSVEIKFGASDYIDKNELLFAYYLKGRNTSYGGFTNNKSVKYDHLFEGDYTFFVKSKNILGLEGQEIKISFTVLPPWYRTIWAYSGYALLLLLLVYFIVKLNLKRLKEQNVRLEKIITERTKEINHQKLEIEHKNREITDSINYAKGIQDSILPSINEIKKVWQDLFIFFQPKDIVSGDFYWFKQINTNEFLIACADCTGHGVPGGFMSMICSDKLNDAARETTEPDKILFLANNSVKESLRQQSEGKSKDGMEICLIRINIKTREVKYAGANRQLWVLDSKTNEVNDIKPTKASIGSFTEFNFEYKLNTFILNKNDILYLSTDGYPDQFGGTDGKKYMSKNVKSFVASISSLPMHEQEKQIADNINNWMRHYEQVDDLLVIGIKL